MIRGRVLAEQDEALMFVYPLASNLIELLIPVQGN